VAIVVDVIQHRALDRNACAHEPAAAYETGHWTIALEAGVLAVRAGVSLARRGTKIEAVGCVLERVK
jgi:hypothetical protein